MEITRTEKDAYTAHSLWRLQEKEKILEQTKKATERAHGESAETKKKVPYV